MLAQTFYISVHYVTVYIWILKWCSKNGYLFQILYAMCLYVCKASDEVKRLVTSNI